MLAMSSEGVRVQKVWGHEEQDNLCPDGAGTHENIWLFKRLKIPLDIHNTTVINLFGVTHSDSQRLHLSWYCFILRLRDEQRRPPSLTHLPWDWEL